MGNEHEKLTKESNKMKKKALKNKGKNNKAIESDEEDSDGEENNNNEKERQLNEYDKEMSKILFEEEDEFDKGERLKKIKKMDKKSELRSYAQEIAEEQFMEDINRSKSFNRESGRRGYKNNGNDSDDYNEFKKYKERKKNKKEDENGKKKVNNINIQVNDEKDDIKNNKKRNISINKKRTISNDNLNINYELEKNSKKRKEEASKNLYKTTANDLFGPSKKKEGKEKEKEEKSNKNYKTKISSPQIDYKSKTLKSTSVNINEKNLSEEQNNNNKSGKTAISKSIYSKVEPEDLRIVLLYMKNGNNKYQEGLDLCGKRKYFEAKTCFNLARNSYTSLSKLMNGNPKAYPSEFRIVVSKKINEKLQLVFQSIRECNEFIRNNKSEINIKKPEKSQEILRNANKNINRKSSNNNFNQNNNFNYNMNKNNFHNNYRNYNNNVPNNNKNINGKEDDEMDEKIESEIMVKNPGVKFNDIIGMKEMKRILYEIIVVPTIRPDLFTGIRKPQRGILLFGPPGTGKTMIAKAIASECNSTFFNISASSLTSKWVGESEKTVKSLFKLAYKKVPSIIFIDEIDSILSKRSENENEATKRLKTEFLIQFDGLGSNTNARLLVIAATNRPMDLDEALLRRLPKRVYCGPLDEEGRFEFIKKIINRVETKLTDKDIKEVAKMTNGYSNSDLKELCKEAAFQPVRELTMDQIMRINKFRPLVKKDLVKSVQKIRGSLSHKIINELLKWNEQFGGV